MSLTVEPISPAANDDLHSPSHGGNELEELSVAYQSQEEHSWEDHSWEEQDVEAHYKELLQEHGEIDFTAHECIVYLLEDKHYTKGKCLQINNEENTAVVQYGHDSDAVTVPLYYLALAENYETEHSQEHVSDPVPPMIESNESIPPTEDVKPMTNSTTDIDEELPPTDDVKPIITNSTTDEELILPAAAHVVPEVFTPEEYETSVKMEMIATDDFKEETDHDIDRIPIYVPVSESIIGENECNIKMEDHKKRSWGIVANLDAPYYSWRVLTIRAGQQAEKKGICPGWKYIKWNNIRITDENYKMVKEHLMNGAPGIITFEKPVQSGIDPWLLIIKKAVHEFIAMTFFVYIGCSVAMLTLPYTDVNAWRLQVAFAFGMAIMVLTYATAHVSGGQINSAVTLALVVGDQISKTQGVANMAAQFLGSILGASFVEATITNRSVQGTLGANSVNEEYTDAQACLVEFLMTFVLCWVLFETTVIPTAVTRTQVARNPVTGPLAIGFTVFLAHMVLLPITGCSINPARSFGPALVAAMASEDNGHVFDDYWIFFFVPHAAGVLAGGLYHILHADMVYDGDEPRDIEEEQEEVLGQTVVSHNKVDDKFIDVQDEQIQQQDQSQAKTMLIGNLTNEY